MGQELKQTEPTPAADAGEQTPQGSSWRNMVWLLIALVVVIVAVMALWGRFSHNPSSTVDPTKTPPSTAH